ncbi:MAG: CPBP family intramembrane metalloprotease, partial [Flavobacteriaceae bacterium]|nr:CPBP family intramembrane metalloprotease [Flavobacteriaceae bacterium]
MFIENAYSGKTSPLRYVLAIIIIAFVYIFSTIPFSLALVAVAGQEKILEMSQAEIFSSLGLNTTLFYMLLPFAIAFFAILFIVKFIHHQKIKSLVTTRPSLDWRRVAFSFSLVSFFALLSFGLDLYFFPEKYEWNFVLDKFLILFLIAVLMIPLQTTAEELLFRGYFMQGLGVAFGNRLAPLLTTSISFGLLHIMNPEIEKLGYEIIIIYIATGLFLGIITLMDEGLELAIGFHAANNLI